MSLNLLPWRALEIKRKIRFILACVISMGLIGLCISAHFYFQEQQQEKRENEQLISLKKQTANLETASPIPPKKADKTNLASSLVEFIRATPPGISLNHVSISEKEAMAEGFYSEKSPLELFIKQAASLFNNSDISIKTNDDQQHRFTLIIQNGQKS